MRETIKKFIVSYSLVLLFAAVAILMDLVGVAATTGKFYIRNPWMYLSIVGVLAMAAAFIRSQKKRYVFLSVTLSVIFFLDMVFIIIYDMTGTMFEFSMFSLRADAMNVLENLPINFTFTFIAAMLIGGYLIFGSYYYKKLPVAEKNRNRAVLQSAGLACILLVHGLTVGFTDFNNAAAITDKIYNNNDSAYSDYGILGNFTNELYSGLFAQQKSELDPIELNDFIYKEISPETPYTGVAEGYNVVTVLCESFEWFSFMANAAKYPNGFPIGEEQLRTLYPNLYEFYDNSVVASNFHALEKTDISETLSIIGSYPLQLNLNYGCYENTVPFSLPGIMRTLYGVSSHSFHDGTNTFYNRNKYVVGALGFDSFTSSEMMELPGSTEDRFGKNNLDSEMIRSCRDEMFPTDRRFNTYITTISMHGQYAYRENFKKYYDILDANGLFPIQTGLDARSQSANAIRYYCASAMELDAAVGEIVGELDQRGLSDKTIVVLFGDHYAYYQQCTNYAKEIYDPKAPNYSELYNIPLMVKVGDMKNWNGPKVVDKFTCTADILPTILDLLGVRYYSNLYYGHSIFDTTESILYSRAYDKFITDKTVFVSINRPIYARADVDEIYLADVEQRAVKVLEKIEASNKIFEHDYFAGEIGKEFNEKLIALNKPA